MARDITKNISTCGNCLFWLPGTSIRDYGYCVKRDCYRPQELTCDKWEKKYAPTKEEEK